MFTEYWLVFFAIAILAPYLLKDVDKTSRVIVIVIVLIVVLFHISKQI